MENENAGGFDKRRNEVEFIKDKKLRVNYMDWEELSALERLPNELYLMVLKYSKSNDEKNLRLSSKRLYLKSTLLSPKFKEWFINATDEFPPPFVLVSDKNFHVDACFDYDYGVMPLIIDKVGNFIHRFSQRISKLSFTNTEGSCKLRMSQMKQMNPNKFPKLTYIELLFCDFDNESLLQLAPQLETIIFHNVPTQFDISSVSVHEDDKSFAKVKKLSLHDCKIDVKKILMKSCTTLKYLELHSKKDPFVNLEDFHHVLPFMDYLCVAIKSKSLNLEQSLQNLMSRSGRLRTLDFQLLSNEPFDFSSLLERNIDITTLSIYSGRNNIQEFLNRCPKLQKLTLSSYMKKMNRLELADLVYLKLDHCSNKCLNSILKQLSLSSALRTLDLTYLPHNWSNSDIPVFPLLDLVCLLIRTQFSEEELKQASKMFPSFAKVKVEESLSSSHKFEIRRVYGI